METDLYTPKQMAERLQVSTTTLRRYEDQGLIPDVPRTTSNRRGYTSLHLCAFMAIRALLRGYEIPIAYETMRLVKQGRSTDALWLVNEQQHHLQVEKWRVESVVRMIEVSDFSSYTKGRAHLPITIGEAAEIAGVNPSAIRHWEKEGLIRTERNPDNGYRVFTEPELRKIIVISSLRKTVYFIEPMKQLLDQLETQSMANVERAFHLALSQLNGKLGQQFQAMSRLMNYIQKIDSQQSTISPQI
ncbi:MerR family DNA-binding transcriptional regulator [Paenibacillus sp. 1P07SE]|uniref:MerR family DNA-binding transcriptional regulator n=1 Tax=Paenibacillus sp. 1P07SE TaxID=3132209 RepID=UPI0039A5944F